MKKAYQDNVIGDGIWLSEDYLMFETIFKFQRFFKFHLDEELLLNMIWLHQYTDDMDFDFLNEIVSREKIKERVIENANASVDENNAYFYIKYLIENEINLSVLNFDVKNRVRDLLKEDNDYYAIKLVELLYSKDINFLKEIIDVSFLNSRKYFLEFVLKLLIEQNKFEIVEEYLITHYNVLIARDIMQEITIIKYLITVNSVEGFKILSFVILNNPDYSTIIDNSFNYVTWQNHMNKESIDDLIEILNFVLLNFHVEKNKTIHFSPSRISTESIVNICKNQNADFCEDTIKKLKAIDSNLIVSKGGDLFYLNKLKKDIEEIILNHKSKPYSFKKVLNLISNQNHIFYSN